MTATDYSTETHTLWLNPLTGATELVPHRFALDDRDREILRDRFNRRQENGGPLIGDFVRFADGTLRRFTYAWDDGLQTTVDGSDGSFYIHASGNGDYSGGLAAIVRRETLTPTAETREGAFWFFHHDWRGAGRGVPAFVPCRVYETTEETPRY